MLTINLVILLLCLGISILSINYQDEIHQIIGILSGLVALIYAFSIFSSITIKFLLGLF